MNKKYSIREYDAFTKNHSADEKGYISLPEKTFDLLYQCVLTCSNDADLNVLDFFIPRLKKGIGIVLQARNYVGALLLKDGTTIEVLPKIIQKSQLEKEERRIFMEMLRYAADLPVKNAGTAVLETEKFGLFQWFILSFLRETEELVKKGLCSGYQLEEDNEPFLKGRLVFSKHITKNSAQKQKFYVEKDSFYENRPENRLIKTTLERLRKETHLKNKTKILSLLNYFERVPISLQIKEDLKACQKDRQTRYYDSVLAWCRIFLNQQNFSSFSGNEQFLSLLFPMDLLFERYIAKKIYRRFNEVCDLIKIQGRGKFLLEYPKNRFELVPDIIVYPKKDCTPIIFDTKWKILEQNRRNFGISQEDIYQMYVYGSCFHSKKVILLYPKITNMEEDIIVGRNEEIEIKIIWIDLFHLEESLCKVEKEWKGII